jgi:hypothetical protein
MPLVGALSAVFLGQLDPVAFNPIDLADVNPISTDDFGVFLDIFRFVGTTVNARVVNWLRLRGSQT